MNRASLWRIGWLSLLIVSLLAASIPTAAPAQAQTEDDVIYLAIIWHQHQPVYYQDPDTGIYNRPWVRVHASKDYLDMAAILEDYPDIHATFNLTPSLIRQLDDFAAGAQDMYWVMAEVPAEDLTAEQKQYLLERFFDINPGIIADFPRYQELANSRADLGVAGAVEAWSAADFRDLQVLFNLAWTDPDWLAEEPLASLVEQGRDFSEADKDIVFAEHLRIIQEVIPYHAQLQEAGQIEVTMTPYAHPILPLLVDSDLAAVAMPDATLPTRFVYGQDAVAHVELGVQFYIDHFGIPPRGMWPAEGSVAQQVVQTIANSGVEWIASDEEVLARSLPDVEDFTRDGSDVVQQADELYRPYTVTGGRGGQVAIVFRDHLISDKVGFEYSGMDGQAAADDFIGRIEDIHARLQEEGAEGPHLVTVLLDGENAWEYYENDGKEFLHALYQGLSESDTIRTVTPSEYLAMTGEPREIETLWPGSWISHDFSTWIGEEEENLAWEYLRTTREAVDAAWPRLSASLREEIMDLMYIAEGSDWFWWYGADQNSGVDESFDEQFRNYLLRIYELMSVQPPSFLYVPVIAQTPQQPTTPFMDNFTPTLDGAAGTEEWATAAYYDLTADEDVLAGFYYGFDAETFYLRLDADFADAPDAVYGVYMTTPDTLPTNAYSRFEEPGTEPVIGFGAERLLEVTFADGAPVGTLYTADGDGGWVDGVAVDMIAAAEGTLELGVPMETLAPSAQSGNRFNLRVVVGEGDAVVAVAPANGPALAALPDAEVPNAVIDIADPAGDDHGPGSYVYPRDAVFRGGAYDALGFIVGSDEQSLIFRVNFRGPVENDWGAPNGMGIHTVDIYIDVDGPENGDRLLLPGRNAVLPPEYAWDYAIWAEGWESTIFRPGDEGPVEVDGALDILTNPGQRRITIRIPRSVIDGDPADWAYAVTIASQEGYPTAGVLRIRDVLPAAEQWRIGGGADDVNHTRLLDVVYPEEGVQESMLSDYPSSQEDVDSLTVDDFGQVPVFTAE